MIELNCKNVLMPVMELVNYGPRGLAYGLADGVRLEATFSDEVLAHYCILDPINVFRSWGFASPESVACSLPMKFNLGRHEIIVGWDFSLNSLRENVCVPQLKSHDDTVVLSYLMTGHMQFPRLSKGIFIALMRNVGLPNADEAFDQIVHLNSMRFYNLLAALEPHEGELITTLRKVARYQLESLSHCIGTREI
jgi:hypothetical protein